MIPGVGVGDGDGRRVGTGLAVTGSAVGDPVGTGLGVVDGVRVADGLGVGEDVRVGLVVSVAAGGDWAVAVLPDREVAALPGLDVAVRAGCVCGAGLGEGAMVVLFVAMVVWVVVTTELAAWLSAVVALAAGLVFAAKVGMGTRPNLSDSTTRIQAMPTAMIPSMISRRFRLALALARAVSR
jgi:hypothetical protein